MEEISEDREAKLLGKDTQEYQGCEQAQEVKDLGTKFIFSTSTLHRKTMIKLVKVLYAAQSASKYAAGSADALKDSMGKDDGSKEKMMKRRSSKRI